ncbi:MULTISPECIES: hypothetical protein [Alphaproteobacteria]|uniref:Uncharacterized protein n=2 Tax=Alphaproteobacteria TaxID=28211 RepID=A0A512HKD3_9HYPH|nr:MULTISPECIES: hypothetical protein [Alphaproteobacteria]GEO85906.1 hypothetical protein RNA01_28380 [Ciceribacter naphthalenivorans]GLR23528.1 hypothetical protein GCM10007920_33190 [Ciceribacter naphthalenivorans]GLT06384.1 hypothetical protein GCM10007926_33190 [Sphingomonas psychrolutea]
MSTLSSAKLYGRVALLRRQVLLRQIIRRAIAGALAVAAFVVTAGLATYALFLAIRVPLGDLGAAMAIAGIYLVAALILLAYSLREPRSPELQALEDMEAAASETIAAETQGMVQMATAAGHRIENLGSSLSLGIGILSALRRLLSSRKA